MNIIFQYDFLYILIITLSLTAFPNGIKYNRWYEWSFGFTLICIIASILMISEIGIIDENKNFNNFIIISDNIFIIQFS